MNEFTFCAGCQHIWPLELLADGLCPECRGENEKEELTRTDYATSTKGAIPADRRAEEKESRPHRQAGQLQLQLGL